jgi:hypothetical protein
MWQHERAGSALSALLALTTAGLLLAGCSGSLGRLDGCGRLAGAELAAAVPDAALVTDRPGSVTSECEWRGPGDGDRAPRLSVRLYQPTSYEQGMTRADSALARDWADDDERHVTVAVADLGTAGYRYTRISVDLVSVVVRGYLEFRELTVELRMPYPADGELAVLEQRAVAFARVAMVTS